MAARLKGTFARGPVIGSAHRSGAASSLRKLACAVVSAHALALPVSAAAASILGTYSLGVHHGKPWPSRELRPRRLPITEPGRAQDRASHFRVGDIYLGMSAVAPAVASVLAGAECSVSTQFSGSRFCTSAEQKSELRGSFKVTTSLLIGPDDTVAYVNRAYNPAFFAAGEMEGDIRRYSQAQSLNPQLRRAPPNDLADSAAIATWGSLVLEELGGDALNAVRAGISPNRGFLVDFMGDFRRSVAEGLPIYRIVSGRGFVWAGSRMSSDQGHLRFFAIDADRLAALQGQALSSLRLTPEQPVSPPPVVRVGDDDQARFEAAKRGAEGGDLDAQYDLALMYHDGRGTTADPVKAAEWTRKVAEQNVASAQRRLGDAYYEGVGVEQSYPLAFEWFMRAGAQGDGVSQYRLGVMYDEGLGISASARIAEEWLSKAARGSVRDAQARLERKSRLLNQVAEASHRLTAAADSLPGRNSREEARNLLARLAAAREPMTLPELERLRGDAERAARLLDEAKGYLGLASAARSEVEAIEADLASIAFDAPMVGEIRARLVSVKAALASGELSALEQARSALGAAYDKEKLRRLREARRAGFSTPEEQERFLADREKLAKSGLRPKAP